MDIQDDHPLRESAKFHHIVQATWIIDLLNKCRGKKKKPGFKSALRKTLLEEMSLSLTPSEKMYQDDPFLVLGYGVNAYFDILYSLFQMMIVLSIACIPMFYVYKMNQA